MLIVDSFEWDHEVEVGILIWLVYPERITGLILLLLTLEMLYVGWFHLTEALFGFLDESVYVYKKEEL